MAATPPGEPPHDILAAEAFPVGPADPALHHDPAHDILAADAFAMPAPNRRPVEEAHDVLAADEFAFPAGSHRAVPPGYASGSRPGPALARGTVVLGVVIAVRRLRRRRRRTRA